MKSIINKKFGALTVLTRVENIGKFSTWLCRCECGVEKPIKLVYLNAGKSLSCGCRIHKFPNNDPKMRSAQIVWYNKYSDGDIIFEQFCELSQKNCFYCDAAPNNSSNAHDRPSRNVRRQRDNQFAGEKGTFIYNGLDRINSNELHNIENVVPLLQTL